MKAFTDQGAITPHPMSSQTEERLVTLIANREIQGGERLVEEDLAQRFGVSRGPIREALRRLAAQGIVRIAPHRGAIVEIYDEHRIKRVAEVRYGLEVLAARDAMRRIKGQPTALTGIDRIIWEMQNFRRAEDRMGVYRADIAFHTEVCRIAENDVVAKMWEAISRNVLICFGHLTGHYPDLDDIVHTHFDYRSFLLSGDTQRVEKFVSAHIGGLTIFAPADASEIGAAV